MERKMTTLTKGQKRILDDAASKMIALHKEVRKLEQHLRETMHDVVSLSLKVNRKKGEAQNERQQALVEAGPRAGKCQNSHPRLPNAERSIPGGAYHPAEP
jgi:hypothetical protein